MFGSRPGRVGSVGKVGGSNRRPSIALDFQNSGPSGDARLTTNRTGGGATYYDMTGTLQLAAANTQRIDYGPTPVVTNYALYSQDFSNAAWLVNVASTLTPAFAAGIDGTISAARVQLVLTTDQSHTFLHQSIASTALGASMTNTVSCWVKSNTGGNQTFALKCTQAGVLDHFSADLTATTTWQRFTFSIAFGAGGTGIFAGVVTGVAGASADIIVWGLQVEVGATSAGIYVPTTAATAQNQTTNWSGNSTFVGGSFPSTLPNGMSISFNGIGVTPTFNFGIENGSLYMDVVFSGAATAISFCNISLCPAFSAAIGQTWTSSVNSRLANGVMTRMNPPLLAHSVNDSSGAFIGGANVAMNTANLTARRTVTETLAETGQIASLIPYIQFRSSATGTLNATFRITMPQTEQSPIANTWIPTSTGLVTVGAVPIGLLVEEGRTNSIRNPRAEGAVAGYTLTPPTPPLLGSTAGGTIGATTYFVTLSYVDGFGGETLVCAERSTPVPANCLLTVPSPSAVANAVSYRVYASTATGTETLQATVAIGTSWTELTTGLVVGTAMPASNTATRAGTPPTSWGTIDGITPVNGISASIVGSSTEAGIQGVDVRWQGTATATTSIFIRFEGNQQIAAVNGQAWAIASFLRVIAGSLSGLTVAGIQLFISERDAGGTNLALGAGPTLSVTASPLAAQRYTYSATNSNATTAFVMPGFTFAISSGQTIDLTLRISLPQNELGTYSTSPILPVAGTPVATARASDDIFILTSAFNYNAAQGTLKGVGIWNNFPSQSNRGLAMLDDGGAEANNVEIWSQDLSSSVFTQVKAGGVGGTAQGTSTGVSAGTQQKLAINWNGTNSRTAINGALVGGSTATASPSNITRLLVGRIHPAVGSWIIDGHVCNITYWPRAITTTELQQTTT